MTPPGADALEAILFASGRPVSRARLARALAVDPERVDLLAAELGAALEARHSALCVRRSAGGYELVTREAYDGLLRAAVGEGAARLTDAMLEALAAVAYGQPIAAEAVDRLRGVRSERILEALAERGLIRRRGPDGPYVTTERFLAAFALDSLQDLPPWPGPEPAGEARQRTLEGDGGGTEG